MTFETEKSIHAYTVKQYNDDFFRVAVSKHGLRSDLIRDKKRHNEMKLDCNLMRARSMIFEIALCNEFELFVTLTLASENGDRHDLDDLMKNVTQFIREERKRGSAIQYLLIGEEHKNKAWHIHGVLRGLPFEDMRLFTLKERLPIRMIRMIKAGRTLYDWPRYRKRFGFVSLEPIHSKLAVSRYMTKYITKGLMESHKHRKGKPVYYASQGLLRATRIEDSVLLAGDTPSLEPVANNDWYEVYELNAEQYAEWLQTRLPYNPIVPRTDGMSPEPVVYPGRPCDINLQE